MAEGAVLVHLELPHATVLRCQNSTARSTAQAAPSAPAPPASQTSRCRCLASPLFGEDLADRAEHRQPGGLGEPALGREGGLDLAEHIGRAGPRPEPDEQDQGEQQRPVGRERNARLARRIDHLELDRVGLAPDVGAQADLVAVLEQLVILLLEHVIVAVEPLLLGGDPGLRGLAVAELGEIGLELRLARGGGVHLPLLLRDHRPQRHPGGVGHGSGAGRLARGERPQAGDLVLQPDHVGMRIGPALGGILGELRLERARAGRGRRRRRSPPITGIDEGVAASWLRSAESELCACISCCSIPASSVRAAAIRAPIEPSPGSRPRKRCSNSTRRCSASWSCFSRAFSCCVEEGEALVGLVAVADEILLDEDVEQALDDRRRQLGVLAVGEAGDAWRSR